MWLYTIPLYLVVFFLNNNTGGGFFFNLFSIIYIPSFPSEYFANDFFPPSTRNLGIILIITQHRGYYKLSAFCDRNARLLHAHKTVILYYCVYAFFLLCAAPTLPHYAADFYPRKHPLRPLLTGKTPPRDLSSTIPRRGAVAVKYGG